MGVESARPRVAFHAAGQFALHGADASSALAVRDAAKQKSLGLPGSLASALAGGVSDPTCRFFFRFNSLEPGPLAFSACKKGDPMRAILMVQIGFPTRFDHQGTLAAVFATVARGASRR